MADNSITAPTAKANGKAPQAPVDRRYAVYEATGGGDNALAVLTLIAVVPADSPDAARWAAVDKTPELKKRVSASGGKSGEPVPLVPIAMRSLGDPVVTFEESVQKVARR